MFGDTRRRDDDETGVSKPYLPELKAKISEVPYEVMLKARLVESSHIAFRDTFDAAQKYLDSNFQGRDSRIRGWQIDRNLSTKESLRAGTPRREAARRPRCARGVSIMRRRANQV